MNWKRFDQFHWVNDISEEKQRTPICSPYPRNARGSLTLRRVNYGGYTLGLCLASFEQTEMVVSSSCTIPWKRWKINTAFCFCACWFLDPSSAVLDSPCSVLLFAAPISYPRALFCPRNDPRGRIEALLSVHPLIRSGEASPRDSYIEDVCSNQKRRGQGEWEGGGNKPPSKIVSNR